MDSAYKTGIFSGRFDPPHIGHILTILKLCFDFSKIVIVILDYPERKACSAEKAKEIFTDFFDMIFPATTRSKVAFVINNIHFGKITFAEYDCFLRNIGACYNHSVYLSGNQEVLGNMEKQQILHYKKVPRSEEDIYSGTDIRKVLGL